MWLTCCVKMNRANIDVILSLPVFNATGSQDFVCLLETNLNGLILKLSQRKIAAGHKDILDNAADITWHISFETFQSKQT